MLKKNGKKTKKQSNRKRFEEDIRQHEFNVKKDN